MSSASLCTVLARLKSTSSGRAILALDGLGAQTNERRVWRVRQQLPDFSAHKARPDTTMPQTHSLARVACNMPHRSLSKQHRSCLRQALAHTATTRHQDQGQELWLSTSSHSGDGTCTHLVI